MSDHTDNLAELVNDAARDIVYDHVNYDRPAKTEIKSVEVYEVDSGTDDGVAFGTYRILVNGGQFVIELEASAAFAGFEDHWDWASESHYTTDVEFAELQDFEYKIIKFVEDSEQALDKMVDADVNSAKEDAL